jgi:hypothetical protein
MNPTCQRLSTCWLRYEKRRHPFRGPGADPVWRSPAPVSTGSICPDFDRLRFLLYILRWLGKRMSGQLTIMELSVMLTLGAIVSASMQIPDHGILEGVLLLLCALVSSGESVTWAC